MNDQEGGMQGTDYVSSECGFSWSLDFFYNCPCRLAEHSFPDMFIVNLWETPNLILSFAHARCDCRESDSLVANTAVEHAANTAILYDRKRRSVLYKNTERFGLQATDPLPAKSARGALSTLAAAFAAAAKPR
jgi:hypothetical protein